MPYGNASTDERSRANPCICTDGRVFMRPKREAFERVVAREAAKLISTRREAMRAQQIQRVVCETDLTIPSEARERPHVDVRINDRIPVDEGKFPKDNWSVNVAPGRKMYRQLQIHALF